jgi:long-chain acyl-CoA synthetase
VALLAANSLHYIEVNFACALAGAILVPLNIRLAASELKDILGRIAARLAFCGTPFTIEGMPVIGWDDAVGPDGECPYEAALRGTPPLADAPAEIGSGDIAQIYFTSGTTGSPKGVCLTHGNMLASALDAIETLGFGDRDVWLHAAPMFHLVDAFAIWGITLAGGVHVAAHFDPQVFGGLVAHERITKTSLPPTLLDWISRQAPGKHHDLSSLELISYGGSPMQDAVYRRCREALRCLLLQAYGLTEGSGFVCHERPGDNPDAEAAINTVGRPTRHAEIALLEGDSILPPDSDGTGEVLLRGARLFENYWNDPVATRAAFLDGWYRTGDLAARKDGRYRIIGRSKDMIISGGENVYPAEVVNALLAHPAIAEAVVFGFPSEQWGEEVRAVVYIAPDAGSVPTFDELTRHCRALIGGYKTPKKIALSATPLPKTGAGKIAVAAIRETYSRKELP